jgi:heterotetrameric sarcosine oxidase gamma subunit
MSTLAKRTPLAAFQRARGASWGRVADWEVALHVEGAEAEARARAGGAVLVDWSPLAKLSLPARRLAAAGEVPPRRAACRDGRALLRLTPDEAWLLGAPGDEEGLARWAGAEDARPWELTGAYAALLLAGPRRDEVLERSTALDLRRDRVGPGSVLQSTVHTVPCVLYRCASWDLLLPSRDRAESLFAALLDVGRGVGLVAAGVGTLPIQLEEHTGGF